MALYGITNNHIRTLRTLSRLTRPEFAEQVGVSEALIAKIEDGNWHVTERTALKVAQAFELDALDVAVIGEVGRKYVR